MKNFTTTVRAHVSSSISVPKLLQSVNWGLTTADYRSQGVRSAMRSKNGFSQISRKLAVGIFKIYIFLESSDFCRFLEWSLDHLWTISKNYLFDLLTSIPQHIFLDNRANIVRETLLYQNQQKSLRVPTISRYPWIPTGLHGVYGSKIWMHVSPHLSSYIHNVCI